MSARNNTTEEIEGPQMQKPRRSRQISSDTIAEIVRDG